MILYRNPRTHELFTEDELRGLFDEQILAVNLEEDEVRRRSDGARAAEDGR